VSAHLVQHQAKGRLPLRHLFRKVQMCAVPIGVIERLLVHDCVDQSWLARPVELSWNTVKAVPPL
jgi:hypothetical protein